MTETVEPDTSAVPPPELQRRRLAVNTAIFAFATALSRIAGLGREIAQAAYFATSAAASAFTLASQVPNLFSNLFSQAALSAAFVPVFTDLLPHAKNPQALRVAAVGEVFMVAAALRRLEFRLSFVLGWRDPRVRRVLILFLPVTISIGIVNLDIFINAGFGSLVSSHAPAAINNAFRIYMLPQGVFSVAVATVLFPPRSRLAARRTVGGLRRAGGTATGQHN